MDFSNNNEYIELFICEVDKTINTGNIIFIKKAIKNYSNYVDISYIIWANSLILEIVQEKLEYIEL